jgi:hypothetical protein
MNPLKSTFRLIYLATAVLMLLTSEECLSQVKKMSARELTKESNAVLYGKCKGKRCEWNENRSAIYTYITIAPEEYIKGHLGSEVVVMVPGGRVDDILYEVSETPFFADDEEVVAFIWTNPRGKNLITGGFQGKMKIDRDEKTGKRMVDAGVMDEEEQVLAPGQVKKAERMELEDFVVKLKGYARQ